MIDVQRIVREGVPIRYVNNDATMRGGERTYFAQGEWNQSVRVEPRDSFRGRHLYLPRRAKIDEIVQDLNDLTGLPIPDGFYSGLNIHIVDGMLFHGGMSVPTRVLRQQIFIGLMPQPYTDETLHMAVFHSIGNALWNYMDFRIWGSSRLVSSEDETPDFAEKNEYRELRKFPYVSSARTGQRQQRDLFYIAAEDFRYLCGTAYARRGEWFISSDVIDAPNPEVINFWRRELSRNGSNSNERTPQAYGAGT